MANGTAVDKDGAPLDDKLRIDAAKYVIGRIVAPPTNLTTPTADTLRSIADALDATATEPEE